MRIGILGAGYVGLVTGACLSDFGHDVVCLDKDHEKINKLKNSVLPIYEPGLDTLIEKNVEANRLNFGTDLMTHIKSLDVIFVAVDTPSGRVAGEADLENFFNAIKELYRLADKGKLVVIKSTVPVGTNKQVSKLLNKGDKKFDVVSNPEFLREGAAIEDFMKPDRVVVGLSNDTVREVIKEIYKPLYLREFPIMFTDPQSAELIKYSSNAFLATKISFINEVAHICEKSDANVKDVAKGMGLDKRIGDKFLHAGPGYGGSCFPKDTKAFIQMGNFFGAKQNIIETVVNVNDQVKNRMIDKIFSMFGGIFTKKIVCFLGVTFKPNTDDMREAPSLTIIPRIQSEGNNIRIIDPKGRKQGEKYFKNVTWYDNPYEAAVGSDLLVILTEWNEFRALDLKKISGVMKSKNMADLRNLYSKNEALSSGFVKYESVGRK